MLLTISHPPPTMEFPRRVNNFCGSSVHYTAMNCVVLFLNLVLHCQSLQSVLVYNFTNMNAMSNRSDFFACSCRVNIYEPAVCYTVTSLSAVFLASLPCFLILPARSDWKSLNTCFLAVMIPSKYQCVFICDLSNLTLQTIFDAGWALKNVGSKQPIAWNTSSHTPSWRFYSHCRIEQPGSPGKISIICHQVLRHPSEHGTSPMGKAAWGKLTSRS